MTYTGLPYSGDMGCIDIDPPGCGGDTLSAHGTTLGSPACPTRCGKDDGTKAKVSVKAKANGR